MITEEIKKEVANVNFNEKEKLKKPKNLEDLDISDNFVFVNAMQDKEIALEFTSTVLGYDLIDLKVLETEKTIDVMYQSKSVRLDVYLKSENLVINIEMQVNKKKNLVFRTRFYHVIMDSNNIVKGMEYTKMPISFVVFICLFDPFKSGAPFYHFRSYDKENKIFEKNGVHTVYFNTKAAHKLPKGKLRDLMCYINKEPVKNEFVEKLDEKVETIKNNDNLKTTYMKYQADLIDERLAGKNEGIELGKIAGKNEGIELGKIAGKTEGIEAEKNNIVLELFKAGQSNEFISDIVKLDIIQVEKIISEYKNK